MIIILPKFKSAGEDKIGKFFASENIHFLYEHPLALIDEQEQVRIWYPDFYLPKLSIVVEYIGMKGKDDYDKSVRRKTKLFKNLRIDFIYITPSRLEKPDWKHYIIRKVLEIMDSKGSDYHKLKILSKKYKYKPKEIGDDWGLG